MSREKTHSDVRGTPNNRHGIIRYKTFSLSFVGTSSSSTEREHDIISGNDDSAKKFLISIRRRYTRAMEWGEIRSLWPHVTCFCFLIPLFHVICDFFREECLLIMDPVIHYHNLPSPWAPKVIAAKCVHCAKINEMFIIQRRNKANKSLSWSPTYCSSSTFTFLRITSSTTNTQHVWLAPANFQKLSYVVLILRKQNFTHSDIPAAAASLHSSSFNWYININRVLEL